MRRLPFSALGIVICFGSSVPAQQLLWEQTGIENQTGLGRNGLKGGGTMDNAGDLDGDGCDDLVVLGGEEQPSRAIHTMLFFFSGKDGRLIRSVPQPQPFTAMVCVAGAGDVDGDSTPDYAVTLRDRRTPGLAEPNRVEVRSGIDDSVLWAVERWRDELFGYALLGDLDLNRDGRPDLLATGPRSVGLFSGPFYGVVFAYDHRGQPLWQRIGTAELAAGFSTTTETLEKMGDLDGDGCDDVVVGGADGVAGVSAGIVLSGRDGSVLVRGGVQTFGVHKAVAGAGDLDGDGVLDLVGAAHDGGPGGGGFAAAFSGRTGAELYRWSSLSRFGDSVDAGIDLDQDGVGDVLVGAPRELLPSTGVRPGAVFGYEGREGTLLFRQFPNAGNDYGWSVVGLGVHTGNPFPVFAVNQPGYCYTGLGRYLGRVCVYRSAPPGVEVLSQACPGTLANAPTIGIRDVGGTATRVHLSGAEPQSNAALILGLSDTQWQGLALPFALGPLGFTGCALSVAPDLVVGVSTGATGHDRGYAAVDLPLPLAVPPLGRVTIYGQWLALGSGSTFPGGVTAALSWQH